ncbi:MAG: class B sortase, partial [Clostridiales bacterium]|nr:class B sortase [Clostridiales bacterium]
MAEEKKSEVTEEEKTDGQEMEPETVENMEGEEKAAPILNIYRILAIMLAVILVVLICIMVRNQVVKRNAQKTYEDLANQVNQVEQADDSGTGDEDGATGDAAAAGTEDGDAAETVIEADAAEDAAESADDEAMVEIPQKNLDWDSLRETNSDIYAWIYIPGTNVDYPVLQHPTDDTYYLNYNMNGTRGYPGCIYTELATSKEFTDFNTVIYGHNMRNKTMFATL